MRRPRELPVPDFYRPENAARWDYGPDPAVIAEHAFAWRREHGLAPAGSDELKLHVLLVDVQRDFCLPGGSLFVGGRSGRGAVEDSDRLARFLYRHLGRITEITSTLDTHVPYQIFSPQFWVDRHGAPLTAHREVRAEEVRAGEVRPDPELAAWLAPGGDRGWLARQALDYCEKLEAAGRYRLYLWPPHCLQGGDGHGLTGVIQEARLFHAWARRADDLLVEKGGAPLTESYSVLKPEVLLAWDGRPLAAPNPQLLERLLAADAVVVAGQAASHCVRWTLDDLLATAIERDPAFARRIWILTDCMSSVVVPDPARPGEALFDFTDATGEALARYEAAGVRQLLSTETFPDRG